jgi:hypothetical protein
MSLYHVKYNYFYIYGSLREFLKFVQLNYIANYLKLYMDHKGSETKDFWIFIWLSFLSLFLGMILFNHRSSNKCNIVQYPFNWLINLVQIAQ